MKLFLTGRIPDATRILLVESGSRAVLERAMAAMRRVFPQAQFDLCTCFPGLPATAPIERVWRVTEAESLGEKLRLAREMARTRPPIAALVCSAEPVMFNWKMLLLLLLPSKMILVNEHGDFFWLDRQNLPILRQFIGSRWGVGGDSLIRSLVRVIAFPFVLALLALTAVVTYAVRWTRLLYWRLGG